MTNPRPDFYGDALAKHMTAGTDAPEIVAAVEAQIAEAIFDLLEHAGPIYYSPAGPAPGIVLDLIKAAVDDAMERLR